MGKGGNLLEHIHCEMGGMTYRIHSNFVNFTPNSTGLSIGDWAFYNFKFYTRSMFSFHIKHMLEFE